jgi:hypothetical protein
MTERDIAYEVLKGIREIKAFKRGETTLAEKHPAVFSDLS